MYVFIFFSMVCSHARLRITLIIRRTGYFTLAGVALTNATDISTAHTLENRKQFKEKAGTGERSKTEIVKKQGWR